MNFILKILFGALMLFLGFSVIAIVAALPLMLLWNWLMPVLFGLVKITFWQAFGLLFLSSILFKSTNPSNN